MARADPFDGSVRDMATNATNIINNGLSTSGNAAGFGTSAISLPALIGNLIFAFIGLSGILLVVLFVYAGYMYMLAGGDETKLKKAKGLISSAVIGLVIILASYALASYILSALGTATGAT